MLKKRRSWRVPKLTLSARRAQVRATGRTFLPYFQTNRRPKVAGEVSLGEGRRHKLDKVILDLDVVAKGEEFRESSSGSYSYDESALPHEVGMAQRKGPMHKAFQDWGWGPKLMEPCRWGASW
jgi:hypothetical protein